MNRLNLQKIRETTICTRFWIYIIIISFVTCNKKVGKDEESASPNNKNTAQRTKSERISTSDLLSASLDGNIEIVQKAVEDGSDVNISGPSGRTPLMMASYNGNFEVVELLLAHGAKIDDVDKMGRTPLIFAASGSFPKTVELLLENGADPNISGLKEGWTPLMWASAEGHVKVILTLIKFNANPHLKDKDGEIAQDFAVNNGHTEVVKVLERIKER